MRTDLKIAVVLGATAVGGVGYRAIARSDDPDANPPAQRAPDTDRNAPDMPQSPAANDVREIFAQATSAAVQGKFEDVAKRFASADRKHLGDELKNDATLRDHFSQFEKDWKSRYNQDFDSSNIDKALVDSSVKILQGDYSDKAKMAAHRMAPEGNAAQNDPAEKKPAAVDKDAATVYFTASHSLTPAWVALRKEDGIGNTWRINVPDNISAQMLSDSLRQHVQMIQDQKGSWPADVNDAYRMIAHQVAVAMSTGMDQPQSPDANTNNSR